MLLMAATTAAAQSASAAAASPAIGGVVLDPLSAPIAGAQVALVLDGQAVAQAATGADGTFTFERLQPGRYALTVTAAGFQPRASEALFATGAAALHVEIVLPLGPLETAISVTAAAAGVLPSQVGSAVTVIDATTLRALGAPDVIDALRLVPGSSLVQAGGRGGTASHFVRGGNANFTRVLLDGVPVNDIGGGVDLAHFALTGIDQIEVLRQANSVVAGPDALAGVVAATTARGTTRVPRASIGLDGGSLGTSQASLSGGGLIGRADYFSAMTRFATDNAQANNRYRVTTYAGRAGAALGASHVLATTLRWLDREYGSPNAVALFGTPDDAAQTNRTWVASASLQSQLAARWSTSVRVGLSDQRSRFLNPTTSGTLVFGTGFGDLRTITGANGYAATGRGVLDWGPYDVQSRAARQGVYAHTTYHAARALAISAGGNYEHESAYADPDADPSTTRHNAALWVEGRGTAAGRLGVIAGLGYARIDGYASRLTPRVSLALPLRTPSGTARVTDTRLTVNAGTGVKSTSAATVDRSLYRLLRLAPGGAALAERSGVGPIGPERGRNLDVGLEQGLFGGQLRARISYFDNAFIDLVEFVSRNQLPAFGVPAEVAAAVGSGAYVNSQSYTARGVELSAEARRGGLRASGSYTWLDARVSASLSSSVSPQFNPDIPGVPIGGFAALVGARPFRRPAHTGQLFLAYARGRMTGAVVAYLAGRSDDTTFLVGSDQDFGNRLLLPNRDLNFGYAKVDASGSVRLLPRLVWTAAIENLLDRDYQPAFGFPALPITGRTGLTLELGGR